MPLLVTIGRVLFAVLFVFSGISKFLDIQGTAQAITAKVIPALPAVLLPYTAQLESALGMPFAQILAIAAGVLETAGGALIALNIGAGLFAFLLVLFVGATIYFFHNFWDMAGAERINNLIDALKNLSLIGGLLIVGGYPRPGTASDNPYAGGV